MRKVAEKRERRIYRKEKNGGCKKKEGRRN